MRSLPKPSFTQKEILESCISNISDSTFVETLQSKQTDFDEWYRTYNTRAQANELHLIDEETCIIEGIATTNLKKLYSDKLSKIGQPARWYYDEIFDLSLDKMCTCCGYRPSDSLDHILAKTKYPALSINPLNLVPTCLACNKKKSSAKSENSATNYLHPYYDNIDDEFWLKAKLEVNTPLVVNFYVIKPSSWDDIKFNRVKLHFERFSLNKLYQIYLATELAAKIYSFQTIFTSSGPDALKSELEKEANNFKRLAKNTWQYSLYEELSSNSWFINEALASPINDLL
ncbi:MULTISPECIES: HNH endonuclease [Bacillus cereus group]|uniref:HNH endonuclease n=1 Tax=Bacillus cereus group TaxID=86661 RepID=UPI000BF75AFA|nr:MULTISPECIES: hypothetical protein [Bacillus cereus group]PEZ18540.1 hypothetical protein CN337_22345 [Bacillus anthracis]PGK04930.1 hypothetical protein CN892_21610 [Bacillus anthracis]PHG45975.1 hypothetical protein COI54_16670 [Bacillus wiedmannii]